MELNTIKFRSQPFQRIDFSALGSKSSYVDVPAEVYMTVFTVEKPNASDYLIDGQPDPTLTLVRGQTYTFDFVDNGHPFYIKSALGSGTSGRFDAGVVNQGSKSSDRDLVFTVPNDAPDTLYYQCSAHPNMQGELQLTSPVVPYNPDVTVSTLSVIVAPGYLGPEPVLLEGLIEERSNTTWTIEYSGIVFNYYDIESIITTVTRDGAYTDEFQAEIADVYPEYAEITFNETVELVGANSISRTHIEIARADGDISN